MPSSTSKPTQNQLAVVHPHAAGIDIGSREHYVAVDPGLWEPSVRTFGCSTRYLLEMGRWLKACGVTTIAMESTGVYWVPVARLLEDVFELEVRLVDPHHVRSVPGRKTDVKDCQWLRQLHKLWPAVGGVSSHAGARVDQDLSSPSQVARRSLRLSRCTGCRRLSR